MDHHPAVRSRLQLGLFDAVPSRPVTTSTPASIAGLPGLPALVPVLVPRGPPVSLLTLQTPRAPTLAITATPATPKAQSKTKLIVDAILAVLPGARVLIVDTRSVLLSQSEKDGQRVVRVHQMFLDGDDEVRRAIAVYLATGSTAAGVVVDEFVKRRAHLLSFTARPLKDDAHRGRVHDLAPLFAAINERYFEGRIAAEIGWGMAGSPQRKSRRSITFGSYDHRARRITMHPVLDAPHVPVVVVARIVHHEMLHAKIGEARSPAGRRVVHSGQFRLEEATFHGAREADAWLDAHLDELLRWRPKG